MTPDLESIEAAFAIERADELRQINEAIQKARDTLAHLLRRRAELLGNIEEIFAISPEAEQPGLDKLIERVAA